MSVGPLCMGTWFLWQSDELNHPNVWHTGGCSETELRETLSNPLTQIKDTHWPLRTMTTQLDPKGRKTWQTVFVLSGHFFLILFLSSLMSSIEKSHEYLIFKETWMFMWRVAAGFSFLQQDRLPGDHKTLNQSWDDCQQLCLTRSSPLYFV